MSPIRLMASSREGFVFSSAYRHSSSSSTVPRAISPDFLVAFHGTQLDQPGAQI